MGVGMKVKIGETVYDSEQEPIMLVLSYLEKLNIMHMKPEDTLFCAYPDKMLEEDVTKFIYGEGHVSTPEN